MPSAPSVLMLTGKYPTMKEVSSYGKLFGRVPHEALRHADPGQLGERTLERIRVREGIISRGIEVGMDERSCASSEGCSP
jgi:hypothetical protein